jgi:hypothetical protein
MVNAIQSGASWAPNIAQEGFKQKPADRAFALSPLPQPERSVGSEFFGADGFTISDAIDIINPLQHLPIIGPLYREVTGDNLDPFSRIAGNTLFFGPIGAAFSSINVVVEKITGRDVGSNIITLLKDENKDTTKQQTASTIPVSPPKHTTEKNNTINTVLAWATAEINHQNSEALKRGVDLPTRLYSTLVTSTTPTNPHVNQTIIVAAQPEHKKLTQGLAVQGTRQTQNPRVPVKHEFLALSALKNGLLESSTTLQQIKRKTDAYTSLAAYISPPSIEQSANHTTPKTVNFKINQTQPLVSISKNAGWLSSFMNDSISKYHHGENSRLLHGETSTPLASSLR